MLKLPCWALSLCISGLFWHSGFVDKVSQAPLLFHLPHATKPMCSRMAVAQSIGLEWVSEVRFEDIHLKRKYYQGLQLKDPHLGY